MNYTDKIIVCKDCGKEFLFSVGEQEFFAMRGFTNQPQRCSPCRAAYRARTSGETPAAPTRPVREMHSVVCAECGTPTQVPFLPRLAKPVYCSACFTQMRASSSISDAVPV